MRSTGWRIEKNAFPILQKIPDPLRKPQELRDELVSEGFAMDGTMRALKSRSPRLRWHKWCLYSCMTSLYIIGALLSAGIWFILHELHRAPMGYEDSEGFHACKEPLPPMKIEKEEFHPGKTPVASARA